MPSFGGQISWLLPGGVAPARRRAQWSRCEAAAHRPDAHGACCSGAGGSSSRRSLFSFGQGIIHPYYTVALSPALGASRRDRSGDALVTPKRARRSTRWPRVLAVTVVWSYTLLARTPAWNPWMRVGAGDRRPRGRGGDVRVAVPVEAHRAGRRDRGGGGRAARSGRVHGRDRGDTAQRRDPVGRSGQCERRRSRPGSDEGSRVPAADRRTRPGGCASRRWFAGPPTGGQGFAGFGGAPDGGTAPTVERRPVGSAMEHAAARRGSADC